jgi:hypothetical protein
LKSIASSAEEIQKVIAKRPRSWVYKH